MKAHIWRAVFGVAFGGMVAVSSTITGATTVWAISLGVIAALITYGSITLIAHRKRAPRTHK